MSKPLIIVQCRLGSTRLPGKALLPLAGLPMLAFLLRRLRHGTALDICLATTQRTEDDSVAQCGRDEQVHVVRGETDNLVSRFCACATQCDAQSVIRVTADNPFTCTESLVAVADALAQGHGYVWNVNKLPVGAGVDGMSLDVLQQIDRHAKQLEQREHLNKYILDNPGDFDMVELPAPMAVSRQDVLLTVDTRDDYDRVRRLAEALGESPWKVALNQVVECYDSLDF